jgi:hypothetical protein
LINIKALPGKMSHFLKMKDHQPDSGHFVRKAEEYRDKARAMPDMRVKSALEAVAREYLRTGPAFIRAFPGRRLPL